MNRFQFLKTCGIALGAGVLTAKPIQLGNPAPQAPAQRYRPGAQQGQILVSQGKDTAWTHHTHFGSEYEVVQVRQEAEGVFADLRFQGRHDIRLRLEGNGRNWKVL